jgi:D-alanyl-D-alanine carboxypeptidase
MTSDGLFRVASITKSFVATVVVMLHLDGALTLDDPISDYLSTVPNGENITIRQVLSHTSGLYNYSRTSGFSWNATYTPEELLAMATAQPPDFEPGTAWGYSNTNYIIAGMIIQTVTGNEPAAEIRQRILEPLGLDSTYFEGSETAVPGLVHGYAGVGNPPWGSDCGDYYVSEGHDPSSVWTAGAMVSNTANLSTFIEQLLAGQLVTSEGLDEMLGFVPAEEGMVYGLGVGQWPDRPLGDAIGHAGALPGFRAVMVRYLDSDVTLAMLVNCTVPDERRMFLIDALEAPIVARR